METLMRIDARRVVNANDPSDGRSLTWQEKSGLKDENVIETLIVSRLTRTRTLSNSWRLYLWVGWDTSVTLLS